MKCEECLEGEPQILCADCDQCLCSACSQLIHGAARRRLHLLAAVCLQCRSVATSSCAQCAKLVCASCTSFHVTHSLEPLPPRKRTGVYWDLTGCRPRSHAEVQSLHQELTQRFGEVLFIKTYGDPFSNVSRDFLAPLQCVDSPNLATFEVLLMDMAVMGNFGFSDFVLLGSLPSPERLLQVHAAHPHMQLHLGSAINPLQVQLLSKEDAPPEFRRNYTEDLPLRRSCNSELLTSYLQELAEQGIVMPELRTTVQELAERTGLEPSEVDDAVTTAKDAGQVNVVQREMPEGYESAYVSLKLSVLTPRILLWTLHSLKRDEMLPSERAVHSRMKEAFALKTSSADLEAVLAEMKAERQVTVREMSEPSRNNTVLIYPIHDEWQALDQHAKYWDYLGMKALPIWPEFMNFLYDFFQGSGVERPRSIPGGRYGCAQFIKFAATGSLQQSSLGLLSYLIQLALNDGSIRYQRTSIAWAKDFTQERQVQSKDKLELVKDAVIQLLRETPEGVSLAQLPQCLKKMLSFPLVISEIGFAKLKDLLVTIPEVVIEPRNSNHPFAVLLSEEKFALMGSSEVKEYLALIERFTRDDSEGCELYELEEDLFINTGKAPDWASFLVKDLAEFIRTYSRNQFSFCEREGQTFVSIISQKKKTRSGSWTEKQPSRPLCREQLRFFRRANTERSLEKVENVVMAWCDSLGLSTPPGFD